MSRKDLLKFDPAKLPVGRARSFEVVNPTTHYHECHYYYRAPDGELFYALTKNRNSGDRERKEWMKARQMVKGAEAQGEGAG